MTVIALRQFENELELSENAICARILERHRDVIDVRKDRVAITNLARIMQATLKLSNKTGFHAMSMRELAKEAGMSMGGLYVYVANKTVLLSMILREVTETTIGVMNAPPEDVVDDPRAHLRWLIEVHLRLSEEMTPWFAFAFIEAKSFPVAEQRYAIEAEETSGRIIADVLEQGMEAGVFARRDAGLVSALIKPLLQDWYVKRAKYRKRGTTLDQYGDAVIDLIENAFVPEASHSSENAVETDLSLARAGARV